MRTYSPSRWVAFNQPIRYFSRYFGLCWWLRIYFHRIVLFNCCFFSFAVTPISATRHRLGYFDMRPQTKTSFRRYHFDVVPCSSQLLDYFNGICVLTSHSSISIRRLLMVSAYFHFNFIATELWRNWWPNAMSFPNNANNAERSEEKKEAVCYAQWRKSECLSR